MLDHHTALIYTMVLVSAADGRMSDAIAETGKELPWIEVHEGVPFEMPSVHGETRRPQ